MQGLIIVVSMFVLFSPAAAAEKTIPVVIYPPFFYPGPDFNPLTPGKANTYNDLLPESITKDFNSDLIKKTIADVRVTVCDAVKHGDVKVYFAFDAEGKVFGIGASASAGIEVEFSCLSP